MRLELTRSTDYAVRAMLVLARNPGQTVSSVQLAERTQIPVRFVTQVMAHLVHAGLVGAVIGRTGGYRLSAAPAAISVLSIVEAVEGDTRRQHCALRGGACDRATPCEIHHVFSGAQEAFIAQLGASSLADVADAPPTAAAAVPADEPPVASPRTSGASPGKRRPARAAGG